MSNRVLKHFRFGPAFARINRTLRSRRKAISKIVTLYKKYGLVSNGCSLCESNNFTLVSEGDRYGFDLKKQFCNECGLIQTYPAVSKGFHNEFYSYHYRPLYLKSKTVNYQDVIKEQHDKAKKYLGYFINNGLSEKLAELSIIEIGCSSGGIINGLKKAVKSVQGCDLDIKAIKFAKLKKGKVISIIGRKDGYAYKNSDVKILVDVEDKKLVTPMAETFQVLIWHLLVSHPDLQINKTKW